MNPMSHSACSGFLAPATQEAGGCVDGYVVFWGGANEVPRHGCRDHLRRPSRRCVESIAGTTNRFPQGAPMLQTANQASTPVTKKTLAIYLCPFLQRYVRFHLELSAPYFNGWCPHRALTDRLYWSMFLW